MTIQELIENSVLDAVGLLDEDERVAFDRAFASASPRVQAMVRAEQSRLSDLDLLLPDVEPPAHMRAEVVGRVREAIAAAYLGEDAQATRASTFLEILPSRKVSPIWRAFAVGSLAAAVVFGVSVLQMSNQYDDLRDAIANDQLLEEVTRQFGSRQVRDILFGEDTQRIVLASADGDEVGAEASIFWNTGWEDAQFYCTRLASRTGERFRLAIVDEHDQIVEDLMTFDATGGLDSKSVEFNPGDTTLVGTRVALIPDEAGAVPVLRSDPLGGTT